jgi:peptidoglycan/LPS O-acetylase OafA/YrhL
MSTLKTVPIQTVTSGTGHAPELDGVRGLAILGVLLAHGVDFLHVVPHTLAGIVITTMFVPGWGGVDLFFTLSGFLITGILLRARESPRYFSSFYMRRILRIFPIYYLYLVVTVLVAHVSPSMAQKIPTGFVERMSYFLYLQNWPVFWSSWAGLTTLWGAYWSLAVEEQFYMVWPAVLRFVNLRTVGVLCMAGFALGLPERMYMMHHHPNLFGVMQWPFSRLEGLLLGAAIAIYRQVRGRAVPLNWGFFSFMAGVWIFVWLVLFHTPELATGNGFHLWGIGVTGYVLMSGGLIVATQHRIKWLDRILTIRPLLVLGRLSYGMYVYHLSVYLFIASVRQRYLGAERPSTIFGAVITIGLAILLVTGVAELSFRFIETPFLRLKRYFPSPSAPVTNGCG